MLDERVHRVHLSRPLLHCRTCRALLRPAVMSDHHRIHSTGKRGIQSCRLTWSVVVQVCAVLGEDLDDLEGGAAESLAIGASRIETRCDYTSIEAPTPLTAAPCFKKNSRAAPICRTLLLPDCLHRPPPLSTTGSAPHRGRQRVLRCANVRQGRGCTCAHEPQATMAERRVGRG